MTEIIQVIQSSHFSTAEWSMLITLLVFHFYGAQFTYPSLARMAKRQRSSCCMVWSSAVICVVLGALNLSSMFLFWRLGRTDDTEWQVGMIFYIGIELFLLPWPVLYTNHYRFAAFLSLVLSFASSVISLTMYFIINSEDAGGYLLLPYVSQALVMVVYSLFAMCVQHQHTPPPRPASKMRLKRKATAPPQEANQKDTKREHEEYEGEEEYAMEDEEDE